MVTLIPLYRSVVDETSRINYKSNEAMVLKLKDGECQSRLEAEAWELRYYTTVERDQKEHQQ